MGMKKLDTVSIFYLSFFSSFSAEIFCLGSMVWCEVSNERMFVVNYIGFTLCKNLLSS